MNRANSLQWPLVIGLGSLALVRPFLSIIGVMDALGKPAAPLIITAVISLVWLLVVVAFKVEDPLMTLVGAGLVYGVCGIVLGATLGTITGEGSLAILNPFAIVSILITNAIWGAVVGLLAQAVNKICGQSGFSGDESSHR